MVASTRGALPEVVRGAGLLFDPDSRDDLCSVLRRLLGDPELQARLRRLGPMRAAEFSWDRAAREMLAAFEDLTPRGSRQLFRQTASERRW